MIPSSVLFAVGLDALQLMLYSPVLIHHKKTIIPKTTPSATTAFTNSFTNQ